MLVYSVSANMQLIYGIRSQSFIIYWGLEVIVYVKLTIENNRR